MCATFGQDCVRAEEYSDNLCGAALVQSYSCDDDYAAIQLRSGHSLGHTFCTCTSGDYDYWDELCPECGDEHNCAASSLPPNQSHVGPPAAELSPLVQVQNVCPV